MMECIVTITVSCSSHTLSKPNCEIYYFNELAIDFHLERNQEYQLFLRMQYFSRLKSTSGEKNMYHNYMFNMAKIPLI